MSAAGAVKGAIKGAVRGRGGRAKAVEAARNLNKKKQLTDNIESHLSHTSLSYASDPSAITSKMRKIAGEKTPLRVLEVPKTPKQEEQQLVGRLDYLHLLHSKRVPRPAGSEVAHIKGPNLQEAATTDVSPETLRQREEYIRRLKDELHTGGREAPATVTTDSEQKQIDKLIADIKHPTEVKEAPGAQTVKEAPEPAAPELTTEQEELIESINDELLHPTEVKEPPGVQAVKETPDGSDVRTTKTGPRTVRQTTDGTGGGTQTTGTDTKIPNETQTAQPGGREPSAAEKQAGTQSGGKYDPTKFLEMAKDKNLGRSERQMLERLGHMRANAQKVFDKGTDEQIKNELGRWGIETREGADYMNDIDEILRKKAESGPTLGDKFRAHHGVGLTGLGVVGVSTLDLANSRGQQSNAQLYSDPFA